MLPALETARRSLRGPLREVVPWAAAILAVIGAVWTLGAWQGGVDQRLDALAPLPGQVTALSDEVAGLAQAIRDLPEMRADRDVAPFSGPGPMGQDPPRGR